ncbi:MAG: GAF domain-containing protein [Mycobacterium sp.]
MPVRSESLRAWMAAVTDISRSVNAAKPLHDVLDDIAELGCKLVGFDYCGVMIDDGAHQAMEIAGSSGLRTNYLELVRSEGWLEIHPTDSSADLPATMAYREGRTIVVPDVYEADNERLRRFAAAQGYRSVLTAPLRVGTDNVGILAGYFGQPHRYQPEEVELAELLAEQTANAIRTQRLRAEQQAVIEELSTANEELRRRRTALEWADRQHRRLMGLVLNDVGLDGLVSELADMLSASVTVQDTNQGVLARASAGEYAAPPRLDTRATVQQMPPDRYEATTVVGQERETWLTPVVLSGRLVARLWVITESESPDAGWRRLIERFALVVGLEILKQRHIAEVQARLSGDLMVDLLRPGGTEQPLALVQRAEALGHDLTTAHWLAVFAATFTSTLDDVVRSMRGLVMSQQVLVGVYANTLVMLISSRCDPLPIVRRVQKHLDDHHVRTGTTVALTPRIEQLSDFASSYQVGVRTVQLRASTGRSGLIDLRRSPLTSLLLLNNTMPEQLRQFAEALIGPVASHDERRNTELLRTLRTWMTEASSTARTASTLMVHPNTVGYRIAKIQTIIGRDLRAPDMVLELQLALHVWDILKMEYAEHGVR